MMSLATPLETKVTIFKLLALIERPHATATSSRHLVYRSVGESLSWMTYKQTLYC